MRLRWTPAAAADLEHISEYLKGRFPPLPYVGVYRVREQSIEVLRVYYSSQNRS
jgi:plasmid stabilization system protein ParE